MDPMKTCPSCRVAYADSVTFCPHDGAQLRPEDALEPGTVIRKKYRIIAEIARGGMGVVYRARHLLWNEDAAIKLLLGVGADAGKQSASFLSEALVMRQFRHPNIVRVEDVDFTEDDKLFIVMEYIQGEGLQPADEPRSLSAARKSSNWPPRPARDSPRPIKRELSIAISNRRIFCWQRGRTAARP